MNTVVGFITHWKTSLLGILAAAANTYAGGTSLKNVLLSAAIALLGLFTSDATPAKPPVAP